MGQMRSLEFIYTGIRCSIFNIGVARLGLPAELKLEMTHNDILVPIEF